MSDEYDLDVTEITLPDELDTDAVLAIDLEVEEKRKRVFEHLGEAGFRLERTHIFGNLVASGAKGLFASEWSELMSNLPKDSIESLANMFRVNIYFNPNSKTIIVNPEVNKGSDTSIWGILSMVEHAALFNLALKILPSDQVEAVLESFKFEDTSKHIDPVVLLSKQYKITNLLDLKELNFEGTSVEVSDDVQRFVAVTTMGRLYQKTVTIAPDEKWQGILTGFYQEKGIRNIQVFTEIAEWVSNLVKK
jgi:hypothetical protein